MMTTTVVVVAGEVDRAHHGGAHLAVVVGLPHAAAFAVVGVVAAEEDPVPPTLCTVQGVTEVRGAREVDETTEETTGATGVHQVVVGETWARWMDQAVCLPAKVVTRTTRTTTLMTLRQSNRCRHRRTSTLLVVGRWTLVIHMSIARRRIVART